MKLVLTPLMLLVLSVTIAAQPAKNQPPDIALVNKAKAAVKGVFGAEIDKARTPAAKKALAVKMLAVANDSKEAMENRWVLYNQARDLAIAAGDVATAIDATEDMGKVFAVNHVESSVDVIDRLSKIVTAANSKPLLDLISATADQALSADDYKLAVRVLMIGARVAQYSSKEPGMAKRFDSQLRMTTDLARAFETVKGDDEDSLGRFLCFRKGDWKKGLPLLAKSTNAQLASLAKTDLRNVKDPQSQVELATAWMELAETFKGSERTGILRRALYWHKRGADGLTGLAKAKADQQGGKIYAEIDEADAKEGLFTSFAGEWTVRYMSGHVREMQIDPSGNYSADAGALRGKLVRTKGEVLAHLTGGYVERFRLSGGGLSIDQFQTENDYPKRIVNSGVATPKK